MKKTVLRLTAGIAVALAVIFLYALAHEGGHALMVLLLGGQVTNFQVNFLRHPPQISYTGVSDPLHRALVSLAGPVLPLLLIPPATLVLRRTGSVPVKGALLLLLLALLSTTLTSAAVSLGCGLGGSQPSEDLAKFLRYSGANPFAVAAGFCVLFALSFLLAWKVGRVPAAAASVAAALRGSPQEGRQPLAARTAAAAVLLAVFAAAFSQVIGWPGSSQGEPPHHTKLEIDLAELGPGEAFYTFHVQEPTSYDFVYRVAARSEVKLRLVNLQGEPFAHSGQSSLILFQGTRSPSLSYFMGFTLLEGEYALEISPASRGSLQVYIDSRPADPVALGYLELIQAVSAGTFTAESYQEEGYELVFQGQLPEGENQLLIEVPGGSGLKISAFAVGEGEVELYYSAGGSADTILQGSKATIGRWLEAHGGRGELRASVRGAPVTLFIYLSRN